MKYLMSQQELLKLNVIQCACDGLLTVKQSAERLIALCNFKHFHEILQNQFNIQVSYASVYRLLTENHIASPKKRRKKKKLHPLRDRKPVEGLMLQADATNFT